MRREAAEEASERLWPVLNLERERLIGLGLVPDSSPRRYQDALSSTCIADSPAKAACRRTAGLKVARALR